MEAINSSLPSKENFPYTLRVVSEITESMVLHLWLQYVEPPFINGCWSANKGACSWDSNGIN